MRTLSFPSRRVGEYTITAISDGSLAASLDLLSDIDPAEAGRIQRDAGVAQPSAIDINCYLVRGAGRTVLIDAGAGALRPGGGRLAANLRLAGIAPSDIDTILLTHAHPDHVGGLLDGSGEIAFPNAELVANRREVDFWQDDGNLSRASERGRGNFQIARQVFDGYGARLRRFAHGEPVPGISAMPLPGHTDGHTGYRVHSGDQSLLVWGDIVHFPHIQIARPEVSIAFDQDRSVAAATRSQILDLVVSEKLLVAGMHLGEFGFAHVIQNNGSYALLQDA
ncbi:MBL fold metallo-hydrolase [Rhodopseudomonas palustris]|uniref:MBL fold metallo-hydrolase n=1 Tax=Rhodopseudomonas palustris TaxID=1076 RepID=UPI00031F2D59